jgi:hypothetical protein
MNDVKTGETVAFWNCGLAPARRSAPIADEASCNAAAEV